MKRLIRPLSFLLIGVLMLGSCSRLENDLKARRKERSPSETTAPTTEDTNEAATEASSSATEETTSALPEPSVVIVEKDKYSEEDAPVFVDWDSYGKKNEASAPEFKRLKEEYIGDFSVSDDYKAVFPYLATRSWRSTVDYPDETYPVDSYGLISEDGTIICDPVYQEAYRYSNDVNGYVLCKGTGDKSLYGFIDMAGTKYTGIVFDRFSIIDSDTMIGRKGHEITVFDSELNEKAHFTLKIDLSSISYGEYLEEDDFWVYRYINDSKCIISFQGEQFLLDYKTGKAVSIMQYFGGNCVLVQEYEKGYYLTDLDGNILTDYYDKAAFYLKDYVGLGNGNKVNTTYTFYDKNGKPVTDIEVYEQNWNSFHEFDDLYIIRTGPKAWTTYDKDLNPKDTYTTEGSTQCYVYSWESYNEGSVPFVYSGNDLIDPLTGKTLIKDYLEDTTYYFCEDYGYIFNTGWDAPSEFHEFGNEDAKIYLGSQTLNCYDRTVGKHYATSLKDNELSVYCVEDDKELLIPLAGHHVPGDYYMFNCNIDSDRLMLTEDVTTRFFDISGQEPETLFSYSAVDPMGD